MSPENPDDGEVRYLALLDEIRAEFPGFEVIAKSDSWHQRALHWLLVLVTFGGQRHYLDAYVTTLGEHVYVPAKWASRAADDRYCTMRHELVHMRQFRRWGMPAMLLAYLCLPLPMGLAWGRMQLEREAYAESVRAAAEVHGLAYVEEAAFKRRILSMFTSGAYAWMWPFPRALERWYDRLVAELADRNWQDPRDGLSTDPAAPLPGDRDDC